MSDDITRWRERVALVTGASSGIGAAVARALHAAGMKLAVCARRAERLERLAGELDGADTVLWRAVDMRDEAQITGLFDAIRQRWGGVDVLVNNAGLGHRAPLLTSETDLWREMLEVNVLALSIATREAVRDMRQRGDDGQVIHIGSLAGYRLPGVDGAMYGATKFAVRALTEGLRRELRRDNSGVRVAAISPGVVETEFHYTFEQSEEKGRAVYRENPKLQAGDVADAVLYLLASPPHVQIHDVLLRATEQQL